MDDFEEMRPLEFFGVAPKKEIVREIKNRIPVIEELAPFGSRVLVDFEGGGGRFTCRIRIPHRDELFSAIHMHTSALEAFQLCGEEIQTQLSAWKKKRFILNPTPWRGSLRSRPEEKAKA